MTDPSSPTKKKRAGRHDARERREALLVAAEACFRESGYGVPLEEIAARVGVSRTTLYRNFKDREALALAIFARKLDHFETTLEPSAPFSTTFDTVIREGARTSVLWSRIAPQTRTEAIALGARFERLLAPVVARAHDSNELDRSIGTGEIVLLIEMASGLVSPFMDSDTVEARLSAGMKLLFSGIRPRPG